MSIPQWIAAIITSPDFCWIAWIAITLIIWVSFTIRIGRVYYLTLEGTRAEIINFY